MENEIVLLYPLYLFDAKFNNLNKHNMTLILQDVILLICEIEWFDFFEEHILRRQRKHCINFRVG